MARRTQGSSNWSLFVALRNVNRNNNCTHIQYKWEALVEGQQKVPATGYSVIRNRDNTIVAKFDEFPDCERALMYRCGDVVSFMPLEPDEIVGSLSLFTLMLERAGYRVTQPSISDHF